MINRTLFSFLSTNKAQLFGFWIGFIVVSFSTLMPASELPPVPGSDKLHHVVGFGSWAVLCCLGPIKRFLALSSFMILWGGAIEVMQPYVNRYGEWLDFFADALGVVLVVAIVLMVKRIKKRVA